jgi:heptosyltransferase-2
MDIAILKTAALGDVVRTTSILAGLVERYAPARVTWITAPNAVDLVRTHPLIQRVCAVDPTDPATFEGVEEKLLETSFGRVLSFDDEESMCALATRLGGARADVISGAFLDPKSGECRYTKDCAPWFDMGLLSVFGKEEADRRKRENRESHPAIFASMLGLSKGWPELHLTDEARRFATGFRARHGLDSGGPSIGLNTGSGGRWDSKKLGVEPTVRTAQLLAQELSEPPTYLLMGGPEEGGRNASIAAGLKACRPSIRWVDAGVENSLLEFAGLVDGLDLLLTSDSLALHLATARQVPLVAFFAPTPAAEIDFYGRGAAVISEADDYASYRPDADTSTLTPERLVAACLDVLSRDTPR